LGLSLQKGISQSGKIVTVRIGFTVQCLNRAIGVKSSIMDRQTAQTWLNTIETKRDLLVRLLEQPDLGTLRIDVNQALEEMDDLISEFRRTFPPEPLFS
jgi:hypothetical protein